jgi:CRISPR-associated endonuclease/helicase Cas3
MIDFSTFYAHAHERDGALGPDPYPWQAELAERLASGSPPKAVVVPNGGGKTATIDALVWALACQAAREPRDRTIGVRIVWAIDRRILVDEVHEHATRLASRLEAAAEAPADPLHDVAVALCSLTGDGSPPLVATRWRGGVVATFSARHPFQSEVITSTVAQVGSRLLFRGYGVGCRSLALRAALTGVDTTICLDEAHLAESFRRTVVAVVAEREREPFRLPTLSLITLTATPGGELDGADVVAISDADRPLLGMRLTGTKIARLVEPTQRSDADQRIALLEAISQHLEESAMSIACVVNSVGMAVDVHRALGARRFEARDLERVILVGPQRPVDRARMLAAHRDTLFGGASPQRPLILVATQTFEVGLDVDVEALVTQSASASALIHRLGRLNRAGKRSGSATIVRDQDAWLYAEEEPAAWDWLRSMEGEDVSVTALASAPGRPASIERAPPDLTRDVIDRLVQTEPRPAMMDDPDIDVFLRGVGAAVSADVTVAWRCDLREEEDDDDAVEYRRWLLRLVPPRHEEMVTLSVGQVRALLVALKAPR